MERSGANQSQFMIHIIQYNSGWYAHSALSIQQVQTETEKSHKFPFDRVERISSIKYFEAININFNNSIDLVRCDWVLWRTQGNLRFGHDIVAVLQAGHDGLKRLLRSQRAGGREGRKGDGTAAPIGRINVNVIEL